MDGQTEKCVMVLDEGLPPGLAANTAGILGITLGKHIPEAVGPDVTDRSGRTHLGIIEFPVPILRADRERPMTSSLPRPHRLGRTACTIWGLPSAARKSW